MAVETDEIRHPASSSKATSTNRLYGSRSMPDLSCAIVDLRTTHSAPETVLPISPPPVPASTEAVEIDQVGQLATAAKTNKLPGCTQSSELPNSDGKLKSTPSAPNLAGSALPPVAPAPEVTGYDYLEKVKELCDEIEPDLFDEYFEKHFQEGHGEAFLISKEMTRRILPRSDNLYGRWEYLESDFFLKWGFTSSSEQIVEKTTLRPSKLTSLLTSATQEYPHILIVEAIDRSGIQFLGATFDIDPYFIAQHLGKSHLRVTGQHQREMVNLSCSFQSFVKRREGVTSYARNDLDSPLQTFPWYNMNLLGFRRYTTDRADMPDLWPRAGTGRLNLEIDMAFLEPHASCYQFSQYSCKI
jgi:hypothetical protein